MVMSFGAMGMGMSGNAYQAVRAKYACGYADNAERPKATSYPMEIIPKEPDTVIQRSGLGRFLHNLYG